jgi:hypothetical protein
MPIGATTQNRYRRPAVRTGGAAAALIASALVLGTPGGALASYDQDFVDTFAAACVPERLSYPGTKANAETLGWVPATRDAHPELAAMMAKMDAGAAEAAEEMQGTFELELYSKPVAEVAHYLVVARSSFIVDPEEDPPDPWVYIGCYLYNFDATAPIDPAPVTALIEKPIARTVDDQGMTGHVWGPPCPMPRTGDTYMSFIAEDSPHVALTGFSGLVIKFETSEPDPGEVVPETYCTDEPATGPAEEAPTP